MKLSYEDIKDYHDKGLLDSMRLSLGIPWSNILDTVLTQESSLPELIADLEHKVESLEIEAESDYNIIQVQQEDLAVYEDYVAPHIYNDLKYKYDQLQVDYDYLLRSSQG